MNESSENRKYESFKIPDRRRAQQIRTGQSLPQAKPEDPISLDEGMFYEIEYDSCPIPGVGKYVIKSESQKIEEPKNDPIKAVFVQMRDIARAHRSTYDFSRFFDRRVQHDNAAIFYKQGMFMKDFTDNFEGSNPFSQYFPYYQLMGYEQLRTYFTWRTGVREGNVANISLSYAFLYIYELLGNIGVNNPQDGLDKLMAFRKDYREYNKSIDKYVLSWLKDYHIYYELPLSFKEFVEKNALAEHYPKMQEANDDFALFCAISKYDIRKSVFYTDDTSKMISECFSFVMERIRKDFEAAGIHFDDAIFRPTRKIVTWRPFKGSLFYHWLKQPDRRVVLSKNEIYMCKNNEWTFSTVITTEKGRQFIGYVMKQMEVALRKIAKYKFKLTANINMVNSDSLNVLNNAGLFIDKIVPSAVLEYHREATKTIVTVDHASLARIREDALETQESLLVEETSQPNERIPISYSEQDQNVFADIGEEEPVSAFDIWESLKNAMNENELKTLALVIQGEDIKPFADECGIMIEVLVDGINEKAMDYIGDNLMGDDFLLYDDYKEQIKEWT